VRDQAGNSSSATAIVTVADVTAPSISNSSASPSLLWPANQKMEDVYVNYSATDECGAVTTTLSVRSNEAESGLFSGDKSPDWSIVNNRQVKLRAERSPYGSGRIYTITITATDARGNRSTREVTVSMPIAKPSIISLGANLFNPGDLAETETGLRLTVLPNPASTYFTIATASNSNEPVQIRLLDDLGRLKESRKNLPANGNFTIGQSYRSGIYLLEAVQGEQRVVVRLIKSGN
jgi:hypothetical protein